MIRPGAAVVLLAVVGAVPLAVAMARAEGPSGSGASSHRETGVTARMASAPESMGHARGGGDFQGGECPAGMALIEGDYCPRVEQTCVRWLDPPGRYHEYRCAEYAQPARCLAPRRHKRFCIDRHERAEAATGLPLNAQSWTDAKRACDEAGARVCMDSEWTFACEGEKLRPYPYGWRREADKCNADKVGLTVPGHPGLLRDEREPAGAHPACASPFGILDMAGNVAEWVSVDGHPEGSVVVQKGNWWQPGKHACRDAQWGHDRFYKGPETGFRCCADAPGGQ